MLSKCHPPCWLQRLFLVASLIGHIFCHFLWFAVEFRKSVVYSFKRKIRFLFSDRFSSTTCGFFIFPRIFSHSGDKIFLGVFFHLFGFSCKKYTDTTARKTFHHRGVNAWQERISRSRFGGGEGGWRTVERQGFPSVFLALQAHQVAKWLVIKGDARQSLSDSCTRNDEQWCEIKIVMTDYQDGLCPDEQISLSQMKRGRYLLNTCGSSSCTIGNMNQCQKWRTAGTTGKPHASGFIEHATCGSRIWTDAWPWGVLFQLLPPFSTFCSKLYELKSRGQWSWRQQVRPPASFNHETFLTRRGQSGVSFQLWSRLEKVIGFPNEAIGRRSDPGGCDWEVIWSSLLPPLHAAPYSEFLFQFPQAQQSSLPNDNQAVYAASY